MRRNLECLLALLVCSSMVSAASVGSSFEGMVSSGLVVVRPIQDLAAGDYHLQLDISGPESQYLVSVAAADSVMLATGGRVASVGSHYVFPIVIESSVGQINWNIANLDGSDVGSDVSYSAKISSTNLILNPTAVPEPSAFWLLGLIGALVVGSRRFWAK